MTVFSPLLSHLMKHTIFQALIDIFEISILSSLTHACNINTRQIEDHMLLHFNWGPRPRTQATYRTGQIEGSPAAAF